MKNEVISTKVEHLPINTMDDIIDIKGYSDVTKLFPCDQICEKLISKNKR